MAPRLSQASPPTPVHAWDEVFIRCSRRAANDMVADPMTWARWWPGCLVEPIGADRFAILLTSRWPVPSRQRLTVTVDRVRPRDKGVEFTVTGDVEGSGEWFHLDQPNGVVVHHLLRGVCTRPLPRLWLAAHRSAVRAGMTSMKDRLEAGRPPGAEPDPNLLAEQAEELEIFAREVAAHEAELAKAELAEAELAAAAGAAGAAVGD